MTVSISGAIDFLQDKYVLSPALQGPVISSSIIGGVIGPASPASCPISTAAAEALVAAQKAALGRVCCVY